MDSRKLNETAELKNFVTSLRSGNLLKIIESNHIHVQEQYKTMSMKIKRSEEEITKQELTLQQNSHLIEKFVNQLKELSNQNSELLEQQQGLKEENGKLKNKLLCSEDKFTQLDVVYDQQVSALSEKIYELETQMTETENIRNKDINNFDKKEIELREKIAEVEQRNADLEKQMQALMNRQKDEKSNFKLEIDKVTELNESLIHKINNYEQKVNDLESQLVVTLNENRQIIELKNKINKLNMDRDVQLTEYRNEKSQMIKTNEDLKLTVEDLKKKLSSKEKELEEVYIKFKQLKRFAEGPPSIQSSKYSKRKGQSTDEPKPLNDSGDSDDSSISFYKMPKKRKISSETEDENPFFGLKNPNRISGILPNQSRIIGAPLIMTRGRSYQGFQQHIEIPESPVVSSSALTNHDQK